MNRREVLVGLSVGAVGAVAGCLGGGCASGTGITFEPVDADTIATAETTADLSEAPAMAADLADRTLEGETPIVQTTGRSPIGWLTYVDRDGRFYEISTEVVAEGEVSGPEYALSRDRDTTDDLDREDAISFDELPEPDRWLVNEAADFNIESVDQMAFSTEFVGGFLDPDDGEKSVLADGVDDSLVTVDGTAVELDRLGEGTATATRIRHSVELVAEGTDEFADRVLAARGAELVDPDEQVRVLLADVEANGGRMDVCDQELDDEHENADDHREGVEALRSKLTELEPGSADVGGNESADPDAVGGDETARDAPDYVRYEGEWYRISLSGFAV